MRPAVKRSVVPRAAGAAAAGVFIGAAVWVIVYSIMRRMWIMRLGSMLATLLILLALGCYPSENPIWTPDTLVYYPELLGVYQDDEPAMEKNTTTLMKGDADKSYRVVTRNGKGEKTGEATLRLIKVADLLFYDYQPSAKPDVDPPLNEFHIFGRLTIKNNKVTLYSFGSNLAGDALRWKTVTRDNEPVRVVANTSEELQAILKASGDKMNVPGVGFTKLND